MRSRVKQGLLAFPLGWGGHRKGAGRKRQAARERVSHKKKAEFAKGCPLHVTIRLREGLPSLRRKDTYAVLREAFAKAKNRFGFRLVHYSVMGNHVHAIVEADDQRALTRGMTGLLVRMARALNKLWSRRGRVFDDHYHQHQLETPRKVRYALAYVLNNARRHKYAVDVLDYFASGPWFDGWAIDIEIVGKAARWRPPVTSPTSWLLRTGWRRHGRIRTFEIPGRAA